MKVEAKQRLKDAWRRLRGGELTPARAGLSVAVGIAIGVMPLWGLHWLLVLAICLPLRLDAGVAYLAANISNPFFAPFITSSEIAIGVRLLEGSWPQITPQALRETDPKTVLGALVVGTCVVAVTGATVIGALAYGITALVRSIRSRRA